MSASTQRESTLEKTIPQSNKTTDTPNLVSSPPLSDCTPPLTQYTSGSNNSSASTSQSPSTPPSRYSAYQRNPAARRYPSGLTRTIDGRTPLHRRGTSHTYEPFEDLLREAGYKETRIFTPETERIASDQDGASGGKSKVAGVVGFLSGFIPGSRSTSLKEQPATEIQQVYSPPTSPTPLPRQNQTDNSTAAKEKGYPQKEVFDDDATPRPSRVQTSGSRTNLSPTIHYTHSNHSYTSIGHPGSSKQLPPPSPNHAFDSRPSRATAYLRHIASVPDMPHSQSIPNRKRPLKRNSVADRDEDEDDGFNSVYEGRTRGNGEGEEDTSVPRPLPRSWLETVANAMLFGSGTSGSSSTLKPPRMATNSRVVSHQPYANSRLPPPTRQLRQSRSAVSRSSSLADASRASYHGLARTRSARSALSSRSGLSDRTNRSHWNWTPSPLGDIHSVGVSSGDRPRPMLMSRLDGSSRSQASEGEIWMAKVVCRSAPTSRASSPKPKYTGRSGSMRRRHFQEERGRSKGVKRKEKGKKSKSKLRSDRALTLDEPPSLSRMMIEIEGNGVDQTAVWLTSSSHQRPMQGEGLEEDRHLNGWGLESEHSSAPSTSSQRDQFQISSYSAYVSNSEAEQTVSDDEEEEESSENEIDLAKMLRPKPQRQQSTHSVSSLRSIRSLRKFLVSPGAEDIPPVPPLPSNMISSGSGTSGNDIADLSPPGSAAGRWFLDDRGPYAERYGTRKGKRESLPSGWAGADV